MAIKWCATNKASLFFFLIQQDDEKRKKKKQEQDTVLGLGNLCMLLKIEYSSSFIMNEPYRRIWQLWLVGFIVGIMCIDMKILVQENVMKIFFK